MKMLATKLTILGALLFALQLSANEFLPYSKNDSLHFVDQKGVRVESAVTAVSGNYWRKFDNFPGAGEIWLWADENSKVYFWDSAEEMAKLWVDFDAAEDSRFESHFAPCVDTVIVARKNLTLLTPMGILSGITELQFEGQCMDGGIGRAFFAPQYGIIGYQQITIAGPKTYQLESAVIDGQMHESLGPVANHLSFATDYRSQAFVYGIDQTISAGIRVTNLSMDEQTLYFNSGQKFEATIFDSDQQAVRVWSAGKFFTQAQHTDQILPGESRYYGGSLSLMGDSESEHQAEALSAGRYQLQFRLMASESAPATGETNTPVIVTVPFTIKEQIN